MSTINEVKKNMFHVMRSAVKFSLNFQGKGTILEGKTIDYKMQLLDNLEFNSHNYKKLEIDSPDFNLLLSKSRKVLDELTNSNYSSEVKRYVNDVAYMFENEYKSIAKIKPVEKVKVPKQEVCLEQEDIKCGCGKSHITNDDIVRFRRIKEVKVIKCDHCNETLLTLLTEDEKIKNLINQTKKEEESLDMTSLKLIGEF